MPRTTKEWIGRSDDSVPPPTVKLRLFLRYFGVCGECGRTIRTGESWALDHTVALINGGENRENNLKPMHLVCHKLKTGQDIEIRTETRQKQMAHYGIKKSKGRPMPGTRRSGLRKRMSGKVERW